MAKICQRISQYSIRNKKFALNFPWNRPKSSITTRQKWIGHKTRPESSTTTWQKLISLDEEGNTTTIWDHISKYYDFMIPENQLQNVYDEDNGEDFSPVIKRKNQNKIKRERWRNKMTIHLIREVNQTNFPLCFHD